MSRKVLGFTIIELMMTIAILAVVAALAVPSFNTMMQNNRVTAAANEVVAAIASARGEAIKRKIDVVMEPNGANWSGGIIVKDATGTLYTGSAFPKGINSSGDNTAITFNANGFTAAAQPLGAAGLTICGSTDRGRLVRLQRSGSVTVTSVDC